MSAAAFTGSYADIKLIRSRSVMQIIVEVPIEQAEAVISAFGVPQPGHERPVAVALLNSGPSQEAASRVASHTPAPETCAGKDDGQPAFTNNDGGSHETDAHLEELNLIAGALYTRAHNPSPVVRGGGGQPAAPDRLVQRVAILCGDPDFQWWLRSQGGTVSGNAEDTPQSLTTWTVQRVRQICAVASRRELSTSPAARRRAEALLLRYDQHCGRAAVDWRSA